MAEDPKKPDPPKLPDTKVTPPTATAAPPTLSMLDPAMVAVVAQVVQQMQSSGLGKPSLGREGADRAEPGGHFIVDGVHVNAWGAPYQEGRDPALDNPELPRMGR